MAIDTEFHDPLGDIDPIMKEAFTGSDLSEGLNNDSELEKDLDSIFDEITNEDKPSNNEINEPDTLGSPTADTIEWEAAVEQAPEPIVEPEPVIEQAPEPIVEPEPVVEQAPEPIVEPEPVVDTITPKEESLHIPSIATIDFPELENENMSSNLFSPELFQNIPVEISVELGRSSLSLKDIYELTEGSIIELQRLTGETLDLVVNGQVIARGEVVTIDNKYGLRINELLSQNPKL